MSLRKQRFVHFQARNLKATKRGFTVVLREQTDDIVFLSAATCHLADQYCKKTGRDAALLAPLQGMSITELPLFLAKLQARCMGRSISKKKQRDAANQWAWIWKYFL